MREKIIEGFKNGIFLLIYDEEEQELKDKEDNNNIRDKNGLIEYERLERLINLKNRDIKNELVRGHFQVQGLRTLLEKNKINKKIKQRGLVVSLVKLKAENNSGNLENEIGQLLHSLYRTKYFMKNIYKSLTNIIKNMETFLVSSENVKTSESHRFKLDLTDKLNLKDL